MNILVHKYLAYSFISVGLFGFVFFIYYEGSAIPNKELWFTISLLLVIIGSYYYAKFKLKQINVRDNNRYNQLALIQQLKQSGEKVRVSLDNAEVISRSYHIENTKNYDFPTQIDIMDSLGNNKRKQEMQKINQSYIVYFKQYQGRTFKFVSKPFSQDAVMIRRFIDEQKGIDLYIDRNDPTNYYYDIPFL